MYLNPTLVDHHVSDDIKNGDWRISTYNYYYNICNNSSSTSFIEDIRKTLFNEIDKADYNYFVNPLSFKNPNHQNLPGRLRNYDVITPIFRRYIGEYISNSNIFHVVSAIPDEENRYLKKVNDYFYKLIDKKAASKLAAKGFDVPDAKGEEGDDVNEEFETFKKSFKDNKTTRDATLLDYIKYSTRDEYLYAILYSDWILYSRYYVDRYIDHNDIVKERIDPMSAKHPNNGQEFVDDYEAFWREIPMDFPTISNYFPDLTAKELDYIKLQLNRDGNSSSHSSLLKGMYIESVANEFLASNAITPIYNGVINVGKLYYKGFKRIAILKYTDLFGQVQEMEVDDDYELRIDAGDIGMEYVFYPTVYVQYCIGAKDSGIYTKPEEIAVQRHKLNDLRKVKLPVTGKCNIATSLPDHSIVRICKDHQILLNLLYLARERAIAKNHGKIAIIPKALLGSSDASIEDNLYFMLADNKLFIDTSVPGTATFINALKELNLSDSEYITTLSNLISETKDAAMEACDMNRQRYGDVMASDGKSTNEQAIIRSSTGSALTNFVFNFARALDYNADIDFTKVAFINGKKANFVNTEGVEAMVEIEGYGHANTEFNCYCVSGAKYNRQLAKFEELAFSAAQNGDIGVAASAIVEDDISKLKVIIDKYEASKNKRSQQAAEIQKQINDARDQMTMSQSQANRDVLSDNNKRDNETKLALKQVDALIAELEINAEANSEAITSALNAAKLAIESSRGTK